MHVQTRAAILRHLATIDRDEDAEEKRIMLIGARSLEAYVGDLFVREGCSQAEAERIGRYLVAANLTGHDSHGVIRVPRYIGWLRDGEVVADRTPEIVTDGGAFALVDAGYGFGQTAGPFAVALGIARAEAHGVAVVALRHAGHLGRIGEWAEQAAEAGLASVHFVNVAGSLLVAPFGAVDRRFSTAPFAAAVPVAGRPPVVLDFATSLVAEGKVLVASQGGKPIPPGSLIDPEGRLSADPATLYGPLDGPGRDHRNGTGAIRAFGEHKGSGLALMCELLAGALTGSGCCRAGAETLLQRHAVDLSDAVRLRLRGRLRGRASALSRLRRGRPGRRTPTAR